MVDSFFDRIFTRQYIVQWLYVLGAVLILVTSMLWWTKVYENPYTVYWDMLRNSLSTTAVTKHVAERQNGTTLDQYITLDFGTSNLAYAKTTLGDSNGSVVTESLGTMQADYVRYVTVHESQQSTQHNFSKVIGKWAKTPVANSSSPTSIPFFVQALLGFEGGNLIPIANLSNTERTALLNFLHNNVVFQTSYKDAKRAMVHGRPIYTYDVSIEPVAYVAFQQMFAQDLGIKTIQQADPNNYQGDAAVKVQFQVDAWSHNLVAIIYPGAAHTETYASYGVSKQITIPQSTLTSSALESMVGNIQ